MASDDRLRWDEKYREQGERARTPSPLLMELAEWLPIEGRALDLAGGAGANAIWLAQRGLEVTLADISAVGLDLALRAAERNGVALQTLEIDLESQPFPPGPWDLIVCVRFLWRPLFEDVPAELAFGGRLIAIHPTKTNLERHDRPGAQYLLDDGELPALLAGLDILNYEEGWTPGGHHEARVVARRRDSRPSSTVRPHPDHLAGGQGA
jgi:hypothetical protein